MIAMDDIKIILDGCLSFLIIKRDRDNLLIEFVNERIMSRVGLKYSPPYTQIEPMLYEKIKTLNYRGPANFAQMQRLRKVGIMEPKNLPQPENSQPKTPQPEVLLTPDETALALKVTRRTVYTWLRAGKLKSIRIGGVWRVPLSAISANKLSPNS
jgi:excisionase family DNA binding protein